jgi:hypothetical protein
MEPMELLFFPGFRAISLKRVIFAMSFDARDREAGSRTANLAAPHNPVHAREQDDSGCGATATSAKNSDLSEG